MKNLMLNLSYVLKKEKEIKKKIDFVVSKLLEIKIRTESKT